MDVIGSKVPALKKMDEKIAKMRALDPELKAIVDDISEITNMSDMEAAKEGGNAIKKILDVESDKLSSDAPAASEVPVSKPAVKEAVSEVKEAASSLSKKTSSSSEKEAETNAAVKAIEKVTLKAKEVAHSDPAKAKQMIANAKAAAKEAIKGDA